MKVKTGSDYSGVGAFDQALDRLGIKQDKIFACDMDKYARKTYIHNYGKPKYYPKDVYDRKIPKESLDVYMTSPPCQGFSLAGKRKGSILFLNSHEFIKVNKPRYFIFENVKGLLSHDRKNQESLYGNTFNQWLNYLGGRSVNGNPVIFPHEESVPYHIYHKVLNAKNYGVPQNRERVFIIGIRDDQDNTFRFPKEEHLTKRLKDVLEIEVEEKYYLSDKMIQGFITKRTNGFKGCFDPKNGSETHSNCITTNAGSRITDNFINDSGYINQDTQASQVHSKEKESPTISAGTHGYANGYVKVKSATVQKDNVVILHNLHGGFGETEPRVFTEHSPTIRTAKGGGHIPSTITNSRIRRLLPIECFRLMDFNESFTWSVSDTQAYKQAGNSIVVSVLEKILKNLNL